MDIQMPIMNGKQATRVIRRHGNPIPIAAMAADAFAESQAAFTPKHSCTRWLRSTVGNSVSDRFTEVCNDMDAGVYATAEEAAQAFVASFR